MCAVCLSLSAGLIDSERVLTLVVAIESTRYGRLKVASLDSVVFGFPVMVGNVTAGRLQGSLISQTLMTRVQNSERRHENKTEREPRKCEATIETTHSMTREGVNLVCVDRRQCKHKTKHSHIYIGSGYLRVMTTSAAEPAKASVQLLG